MYKTSKNISGKKLYMVEIQLDKTTCEGRFEWFYRMYSKTLFLYEISFLVVEEDAEDVISEVFINFWKSKAFEQIQDEAVKTYLFRSVRNTCLNLLKKKSIQRDILDEFCEDVLEQEVMNWNDELIRDIEFEISTMPERTREIIYDVFFHGMKYQEVADRLGISINTVKTLLRNGIKHLKTCFAERMDLFLYILLIR